MKYLLSATKSYLILPETIKYSSIGKYNFYIHNVCHCKAGLCKFRQINFSPLFFHLKRINFIFKRMITSPFCRKRKLHLSNFPNIQILKTFSSIIFMGKFLGENLGRRNIFLKKFDIENERIFLHTRKSFFLKYMYIQNEVKEKFYKSDMCHSQENEKHFERICCFFFCFNDVKREIFRQICGFLNYLK